jgi:hypothetical protein
MSYFSYAIPQETHGRSYAATARQRNKYFQNTELWAISNFPLGTVFYAVDGLPHDSEPPLKISAFIQRRIAIMHKRIILSAAALILFAGPAALAQTSTSTTTTTAPPTIQDRKTDQQDRIANGVGDGQLTPGESKNLETKEAGVNQEERNMRSQDDGHLTTADRTKINNQQNHLSNQIYADKHNSTTDHFGNGEVGQRQKAQQARIARGMKSGQLTAGESAKLEKQQQGINQEKNGMKEANGGKLSGGDKTALNHQQNAASKNIYAKKHNAAQR